MLTNGIIQEYYRLLFEEFAQMKRSKQKEEKDCALKIDNKPLYTFGGEDFRQTIYRIISK